jgi:hypothetical protein
MSSEELTAIVQVSKYKKLNSNYINLIKMEKSASSDHLYTPARLYDVTLQRPES